MSTSAPSSPSRALVALPHASSQPRQSRSRSFLSLAPAQDDGQWQPILHASNQVVLYNPHSHALSIASASTDLGPAVVVARRQRRAGISSDVDMDGRALEDSCPYCKQSLPAGFRGYPSTTRFESTEGSRDEEDEDEGRWEDVFDEEEGEFEAVSTDPAYHSRASDYFRLLAIANETSVASGSRRPSLSPGYQVGEDADDWRSGRSLSGDSRVRSTSGGAGNKRAQTLTPGERTLDENRSVKGAFPAEKMAEGYFKTFFQEEYKLGMGANGTVFLCQHVLDGNPLGHFAVKKIAVGESHSYLLKILREVRLLERLHHPNIITYHHAWLETAQFSSFGPKVPTLHVLMQWAEGGSLDDFIDVRLGRKPAQIHMHPLSSSSESPFSPSGPPSPTSSTHDLPADYGDGDAEAEGRPSTPTQTEISPGKGKHPRFADADTHSRSHAHEAKQQHASSNLEDPHSRSARIRAFRAYQRAPPEEKDRMRREMEGLFGPTVGTSAAVPAAAGGGAQGAAAVRAEWTPVQLSAEEVKSLFQDVVEGLGFLHSKSILHLDLKPGNVLLTWDEGRLIPRAMLSDFGTSRDMINSSRMQRSGNTGTLEYTAPESLPSPHTGLLQQIDSKADMWSLGMILHKLLFFKLPYRYAAEGDANGEPISRDEEGEKMERLEKEVLEYPGFKSTPNLVAGFEARRLPRAYLVLLENLLHKSPAGRPSSERVTTAIREGKLDPLSKTTTAKLPLARPRTEGVNPHGGSSSAGDNAAATPPFSQEKSHLLALPSPIEILGPEEGSWRKWSGVSWQTWVRLGKAVLGIDGTHSMEVRRGRKRKVNSRERERSWGVVGMKLVRSSLLVAKVLTLPRLCTDPTTRPRPVVAAVLLVLAVADTVVDYDYRGGSDAALRRGSGSRRRDAKDGQDGAARRWRGGGLGAGVWITVGLALLHFGVLVLSANGGGIGGEMPVGEMGLWRKACCIPRDGGHAAGFPALRPDS